MENQIDQTITYPQTQPTQTPPLSKPGQPTLIPESPKQNYWKVAVIALVILTLILASGLIYVVQKQATSQSVDSVSVPNTESLSTKPSSTMNYKIYQSPQGYSFQYPGNWILGDTTESYVEIIKQDSQMNPVTQKKSMITFGVSDKNPNLAGCPTPYDTEIAFTAEGHNLFLGIQKQNQQYLGGVVKEQSSQKCWFQIGNNYYTISTNSVEDISQEATQILTTFKFGDSSQIQVSNWKMYSNSKYKISLSYPANYSIEENETDGLQLIFNKSKANQMIVNSLSSQFGIEKLYFDTEAKGQITVGKNTWYEFYLPNGYGDGGVADITPLYGLQLKSGDRIYNVGFRDQSSLTSEQKAIIETISFN